MRKILMKVGLVVILSSAPLGGLALSADRAEACWDCTAPLGDCYFLTAHDGYATCDYHYDFNGVRNCKLHGLCFA